MERSDSYFFMYFFVASVKPSIPRDYIYWMYVEWCIMWLFLVFFSESIQSLF